MSLCLHRYMISVRVKTQYYFIIRYLSFLVRYLEYQTRNDEYQISEEKFAF